MSREQYDEKVRERYRKVLALIEVFHDEWAKGPDADYPTMRRHYLDARALGAQVWPGAGLGLTTSLLDEFFASDEVPV
jgi:hypothetical protein